MRHSNPWGYVGCGLPHGLMSVVSLMLSSSSMIWWYPEYASTHSLKGVLRHAGDHVKSWSSVVSLALTPFASRCMWCGGPRMSDNGVRSTANVLGPKCSRNHFSRTPTFSSVRSYGDLGGGNGWGGHSFVRLTVSTAICKPESLLPQAPDPCIPARRGVIASHRQTTRMRWQICDPH